MFRAKTYLKKNDNVIVIAGKEKGKSGRLMKILPKTSRGLVEKLNTVKRHQKPTQGNRQGGIVEKESGIHLSNLMLLCPKCVKPVRIRKKEVNGKNVRICGKCGEALGSAA